MSPRTIRGANLLSVLILVPLVISACAGGGEESPNGGTVAESPPAWDGTAFDDALVAHGGLDTWRSFGTLEYDLVSGGSVEHHVVDLRSRSVRIEHDDYRLGYDGGEVWVEPGLEAFSGNPMFYSSLHFYFFSLPFVLADPGTVHSSPGTQTIDARTYRVHEVSFEAGVGESPDDVYRLLLDPDSNMLRILLYTATYYSGEPSDRFNARTYDGWQEVAGLLVPTSYTPHRWNPADSTLGESRSTVAFENVELRAARPARSLFSMPEGAEVFVPDR